MNAAAPAAAPEQPSLTNLVVRFLRFLKDSFVDPLGETRVSEPDLAAAQGIDAIRLIPIEIDGLENVFDDLARATWEDAEWQ